MFERVFETGDAFQTIGYTGSPTLRLRPLRWGLRGQGGRFCWGKIALHSLAFSPALRVRLQRHGTSCPVARGAPHSASPTSRWEAAIAGGQGAFFGRPVPVLRPRQGWHFVPLETTLPTCASACQDTSCPVRSPSCGVRGCRPHEQLWPPVRFAPGLRPNYSRLPHLAAAKPGAGTACPAPQTTLKTTARRRSGSGVAVGFLGGSAPPAVKPQRQQHPRAEG